MTIEALYIGTVPSFDPLSRALAGLAALAGTAAALMYAAAGLSLSHYDAKAHLVVARRILDSLTPGWEQIGAVWLPLPHVLNALPVQVDLFYRTGLSAIVMSIAASALAAGCLAALTWRLTRSPAGAVLGAAVYVANPNVLYLQSTPMTEPLLFGLTALVVVFLTDWALSDAREIPRAGGWTIVAAWLTRYEAWPVVVAALVLAGWAKWRRGAAGPDVVAALARAARYPLGALAGFLCLSRITIGEWFVTGGFYVPDASLRHLPRVDLAHILQGVDDLAGSIFLVLSIGAAGGLALTAAWSRRDSVQAVPLALFASAALPFYAYWSGHPFRIRYEVPLVLAGAAALGIAAGRLGGRARWAAAIAAVAIVMQAPPLDRAAPMVMEAQLDRVNGEGRRAVSACLENGYDGSTIFASMGALAHYMQELSREGFAIADFLHEGNAPFWQVAMAHGPAPLAGWVLVEEYAEGGDVIYQRQQHDPAFLAGYDRVCEGGHVALYRRR